MCKTVSSLDDKCVECEEGYTLMQDLDVCILFGPSCSISNCVEYIWGFDFGTDKMCKTCSDGFYLSSNQSQCLTESPEVVVETFSFLLSFYNVFSFLILFGLLVNYI